MTIESILGRINPQSAGLASYLDGGNMTQIANEYGLWSPEHPSPEMFRWVLPALLELRSQGRQTLTALDLGPGDGQESLALALFGCRVTLAEKMPESATNLIQLSRDANLPWQVIQSDFTRDFPAGQFDCVILKSAINHTPKPLAIQVLKNTFQAVGPGGVILVRVQTRQSSAYWDSLGRSPQDRSAWSPEFDTVYTHCDCHECAGETQSAHTVFQKGEILLRAARHGLQVVHYQGAPTRHHENVMYGEDFGALMSIMSSSIYDNPSRFMTFGMDTLVATNPILTPDTKGFSVITSS